ncbi:S1 RNA-binding domain-containing protein [Leptolyngbya sp. FACHB-36]|uniref:S1 RNA-binding domain-containing protein n=1 Tax=Leptolyngbya sp. FACHB-36 TaxID=2692808 RepID=UPI00168038B0|nr:S1 RNA-binding domain-containing protein [Leptolyngbya sp. FACHB-36]MBD2021401.1 S1 RNA-binding domain-containing protein [Leptolyngbya sp. FACHB-36]
MDSNSTRTRSTDASFSMDDFAKALEGYDYQFQKGQVVQGKPVSYESDGAFVDIGAKSPAFLPTEEASLRRVANLSAILPLGEDREFMIIREQNAEGQVTLSLRQFEIKRAWDRLAELQDSNQSLQVRVTGVNKGGVTVDVQGLRGFIPRSHLVERENLDALKGQTLSASLLEINPDTNKLVLSNRLATRSASFSQLEVGQLIEGKVTSIKPFGVFVEFDGTTGLLHINQISKNYVQSLPALFQVGDVVKAMIADLDEGKGRVSLTTKVLENFPGEMIEKTADVMAEAESREGRARKALLGE